MTSQVETEETGPGEADRLVLEPASCLEGIREEWEELARRSGNVFQTWEWSELWWRHFGEQRPLLLTAARRPDGEPVAILPLYLAAGRPLRTVCFLGHGAAQDLGPICAPEDGRLAAGALRRALAEASHGWDLFIGDALPRERGWRELLGGRVAAHTASPLVRVEGLSWEEFLGQRSRKFRRTMRNHERRLARDWGLRYRLADDPARLGDDMDLLDRLHEKRWGGRPGGWRYAQTSRFERELAPLALERGWLRLWIMELEGRPAQALLGFRYGGVEWAHRVGRDPDPRWGTLSIGLVLFGHAIREAIGEGVHTYHFGRGASEFKARFTDEDPGLDQVVLARGPVGRAALQTWRPDSWWLSAISSWRGRRRYRHSRRRAEVDRLTHDADGTNEGGAPAAPPRAQR